MSINYTRYPCPCCSYKTLADEPDGTYDICPVCFWEDDPVQLNDPDYRGGANIPSLKQAQKNFMEFGACEERLKSRVRSFHPEESRDESWKPLD